MVLGVGVDVCEETLPVLKIHFPADAAGGAGLLGAGCCKRLCFDMNRVMGDKLSGSNEAGRLPQLSLGKTYRWSLGQSTSKVAGG